MHSHHSLFSSTHNQAMHSRHSLFCRTHNRKAMHSHHWHHRSNQATLPQLRQ